MKTYRLDPNKLAKQKKSIGLTYGITLAIMMVLVYFMNRGKDSLGTALLMVLLITAMYVYTGFRAYRQRVQLWEDYTLTLDEEAGLIQTQPKYPEFHLAKADITGIEEVKNGMYLSGKQGRRIVGISRELSEEDFEEVKSTINAWIKENSSQIVDAEFDDDEEEIVQQLSDGDSESDIVDPETTQDEQEELPHDKA